MDSVDRATRSRIMGRIKGRDTAPELTVRRALHARGLRYRLHRRDLPGRPDIVFGKFDAAIFVHGCFWHGHECPHVSSAEVSDRVLAGENRHEPRERPRGLQGSARKRLAMSDGGGLVFIPRHAARKTTEREHALEAAPRTRLRDRDARVSIQLPGLGGGADEHAARPDGGGAGAHDQKQGGGCLRPERPVRDAAISDGGVGRLSGCSSAVIAKSGPLWRTETMNGAPSTGGRSRSAALTQRGRSRCGE